MDHIEFQVAREKRLIIDKLKSEIGILKNRKDMAAALTMLVHEIAYNRVAIKIAGVGINELRNSEERTR